MSDDILRDELDFFSLDEEAGAVQGRRQVDRGGDVHTLEGFEEEAAQDIPVLLSGFKQRAREEEQRLLDAVDSEYWVAVCFQTRAQKEEFLRKLGLLELGDKYLDGMEVAGVLGVELDARVPEMPRHRRFGQEFTDMAMELD